MLFEIRKNRIRFIFAHTLCALGFYFISYENLPPQYIHDKAFKPSLHISPRKYFVFYQPRTIIECGYPEI